jgi:hypothetical protein
MSTRDNIRHIVSTSAPSTGNLGDEWFNPSSNRFFKRIATSGTNVTWAEQPAGAIAVTSQGGITVTSGVVSASSTTGALVVSGGVGVSGDLYIGGTIYGTVSGGLSQTISNLSGGTAGSIVYQSSPGVTSFIGIGPANTVLQSNGTTASFVDVSGLSASQASTSTNLAGAATGSIPYQTSVGRTGFIPIGPANYVLASNGTTATWVPSQTVGANIQSTGTTAQFIIRDATAATSTSSGALQVVGGAGIGGDLYIGGALYVASGLDVSIIDKVQSLTITAGVIVLNLDAARLFTVTLSGPINTITITNASATGSSNFVLIITYTGTPYSVSWPASMRWADGLAPTLTGTAGKSDIFTAFTVDAGSSFYAVITGKNF